MASDEDREHAEGLRHDYARRLRVRERQLARLGDTADPSIEVEIAQLRLNIEALDVLLDVTPDEAVQEVAGRMLEDNTRFLFTQAVKTNQRLAKVEERVDMVATQQHSAQLERLAVRGAVESLELRQAADDLAAVSGRRRNFILLVTALILLFIIGGAIVALAIWVF